MEFEPLNGRDMIIRTLSKIEKLLSRYHLFSLPKWKNFKRMMSKDHSLSLIQTYKLDHYINMLLKHQKDKMRTLKLSYLTNAKPSYLTNAKLIFYYSLIVTHIMGKKFTCIPVTTNLFTNSIQHPTAKDKQKQSSNLFSSGLFKVYVVQVLMNG